MLAPNSSLKYPAKQAENVFLLELPKELVGKEQFYIKSDPESGTAFLATDHSTFKMRQASTSNTIQIVADGAVLVETNAYIELAKHVPILKSLKRLLNEHKYPGKLNPPHELSINQIYETFPASNDEIDRVLKMEKALNIDGYYRKLSPDYLLRFFEILHSNAILSDTSLLKCSVTEFEEMMAECEQEYPAHITRQILSHYSVDGNLSPCEVVRLFGYELLRAKPSWKAQELEVALQKLIGDLEPNLDHLKGLYLEENSKVIFYPFDHLPDEPEARFEGLFSKRPKWKYDDIVHFLKDIGDYYQGVDKMIVKYCRIWTDQDGNKCVASKLIHE